jgi:hypothetical protein
MGREYSFGRGASIDRDVRAALLQRLDHRFDEAGMIVEDAQLVDVRRRGPDLLLCGRDVLAVLAAAGIRTVRAGEERQGPPHAISPHLGERFGKQRMPVPVTPINWQLRPVGRQFLF